MRPTREPIGVIGTGYVGLVTAAGFAELGNDVHCIDIDAGKIERLEAGEIPIYEPGLAEMVERNRERLHFSTAIGDALQAARLMFVAVGTPPTYSGDADLSAVNAVVGAMPASDDHALVMKSTVPVGTGRNIKRLFAEQDKSGFRYVSCPEFLKEGSAIDDFIRPDRVVVGDDGDWAGDAVVDLYRPLLTAEHGGDGPGELVRTDIASAEMVKLAANAFLATKISFINEIANVCEETGADVTEVAKGMGLDKRIGPKFLQPGVGFGGSCFPKDVTGLKQLAGNSGYHFQLLNAVLEVNELQKRRVIGKLHKHLDGNLVGKKIALLGLAFKPNTDDMREATSLVLTARMQAAGATVSAYDPVAEEEARKLLAQRALRLERAGRRRGRRRGRAGDRVAGVLRARLGRGRRRDGRDDGHRRAQRPGSRGRPGRRAHLRGHRARVARHAGGHPGRRRGHAAAAAHERHPEADRHLRRPAVHGLHARVAGRPRGRRRDHVLRLPGHQGQGGPRRRLGLRGPPALRRGARAPRDRRRAEVRRGPARRALPHAQRRHADRSRREGPGRAPRAQPAPWRRSASSRWPTRRSTASCSPARTVPYRGFLEKPGRDKLDGIPEYLISAGCYVLEREILERIAPDRNVSIETVVWPQLVGNGLYGFAHRGHYWMDIGTPDRYLEGTADILLGNVETSVGARLDARGRSLPADAVAPGAVVVGAVIAEEGVRIAAGARVVGPTVLGRGVQIGAGAVVERSVVLEGTSIAAGAHVTDAILSPGVRIGERTVVEGQAVLGEGVIVGSDCRLAHGIKVFPGTALADGAVRF